jgi:hypothetical protein
MTQKVQVKVSGNRKAVEQFLCVIKNTFELMVESKLLVNRDEDGVHCFIDLDPFVIRGEQNGKT